MVSIDCYIYIFTLMKKINFLPTLILAASVILWSCGGSAPASDHNHAAEGHDHAAEAEHGHEGHDHAPGEHPSEETEPAGAHSDEIIFTPAQAAAAGVETQLVAAAPFESVIKVGGQIVSAAGDVATIGAPTAGLVWFANRSITIGGAVKKGEVIARINSSKIEQGDAAAKAKAEYNTAKSAAERGESLAKDNIISKKDLEQLKLTYQNAKISYDAFAGSTSDAGVAVSSPIGGYIKNILVAQGDYVTVGQPIATVVQNKRVQLRGDVPQKHFNALPLIKSANFVTTYDSKVYKTGEMNGRLISNGKTLDGNSFYIPVTFEMDNIGSIIPGSFVEVFLLSSQSKNSISVPTAAVIEQQGIYYVFVQLDEEGYQKAEVTLGATNGDRIEILSGLVEGQTVVTKGAVQVKLAASSSIVAEGHSH